MKAKNTPAPVYRQKICTEGKVVIAPIPNARMFVNDVTVTETAASL